MRPGAGTSTRADCHRLANSTVPASDNTDKRHAPDNAQQLMALLR
jgi:hypothetical protein